MAAGRQGFPTTIIKNDNRTARSAFSVRAFKIIMLEIRDLRQMRLVRLELTQSEMSAMTGAWSGCIAASLFRIKFRYAFPAIVLGVLGAGVIVLAVCMFGKGAYSIFIAK